MRKVSFEEIVEYISGVLQEVDEDSQFTDPQLAVLKAGWEDLNYDKISEYFPYNPGYLRCVASPLWQKLTSIFDEEISKRTFRKQMEKLYRSRICDEVFEAESDQDSYIYGQPPITYKFYGRQEDIKLVNKSLETTKCISICGAKGIGKTGLAAKIFKDFQSIKVFNSLIWHHANTRTVSEDLTNLLYSLYGENIDESEKAFFQELQKNRKLVIFDGVDIWNNKEEIDKFLKRLVEINHNSLVILTSKVNPEILEELELNKRAVINIQLHGLKDYDVEKILSHYSLKYENDENKYKFINTFQGNPYLIHKACERIKNLFNGNVNEFISKTSYAKIQFQGEFERILSSSRIGEVERFILNYFPIIAKELPIKYNSLVADLEKNSSFSNSSIENGLETLKKLSLISFVNEENKIYVSTANYFIKYIKASKVNSIETKRVP